MGCDDDWINLPSLYAAFYSVKENHGCAGVDGVTIEMFETDLGNNLKQLNDELVRQIYSPLPLLKMLVDKGNDEPRALCVPPVKDRVVQTAMLQDIGPLLDKEFEDCRFAYRKGHSIRQAINKIKQYYEQGYHWIVDADIDAYFDNVVHQLLLTKIKKYIHDPYIQLLIEQWLKTEVWDGTSLTVLQKGIPQGSPISPVLANLFLDEFDEELIRNHYRIIRFSDDFIIMGKKLKEAKKGLQLSKEILEKLLLKLDEEEIVSFEQGFTFLGVTFVRIQASTISLIILGILDLMNKGLRPKTRGIIS